MKTGMRRRDRLGIPGIALVYALACLCGAEASDTRAPAGGVEPPGCVERPAETPASLRAMVKGLIGVDDPNQVHSWDRLRCAIHHHPQLALELFLPLVGTNDRIAALAAAKAMGQIGPAASPAVPGLMIMLRSPDEDSRAMAAQSLASIGPAAEPAVDFLIGALDDQSPMVRREAARALAHIGPAAARAARPIARQLRDPHPQVRQTAAYALQELALAGRGALPELIALLDDEDAEVRRYAAVALGNIGPYAEPARAKLEAIRDDAAENANTRSAARTALGRINLRDAVWKLRETAGPLLPLILARVHSEDPEQCLEGVTLLGLLGASAQPAIEDLIALLDDPHPLPRVYAAVALGEIGSAAANALPRLSELQWDRDYRISGSARKALSNIREAKR